jgi:tetratricopeptide (TPR) repeat protein
LRTYSQGISIFPEESSLYMNRANTYKDLQRFESALRDYNTAIKLDPTKCAYANTIDYTDEQVYYNRGNLYLHTNHLDKAIRDFHSCIKYDSTMLPAWLNLCQCFVRQGAYDKELEIYSRALAIDSNSADIYYNRAIAFSERNEREQAFVDFHKAFAL